MGMGACLRLPLTHKQLCLCRCQYCAQSGHLLKLLYMQYFKRYYSGTISCHFFFLAALCTASFIVYLHVPSVKLDEIV